MFNFHVPGLRRRSGGTRLAAPVPGGTAPHYHLAPQCTICKSSIKVWQNNFCCAKYCSAYDTLSSPTPCPHQPPLSSIGTLASPNLAILYNPSRVPDWLPLPEAVTVGELCLPEAATDRVVKIGAVQIYYKTDYSISLLFWEKIHPDCAPH